MEVHAHTHTVDPDGHRGRKKWMHYFWEFLMLFLAVFAGFLAENQREHIVEHQRAKAYAANLYEELGKDTTRLNTLIARHTEIAGKLDTFCLLVKGNEMKNVTSGMLYYYSYYVTKVEYFSSNNTTVEQLKGSGNLRIMGNELAYRIGEYDKLNRELENEYGLSKAEFAKMEDLHFKIFDIYTSENMFSPGPAKEMRDSAFRMNDLPVKNDPELMREYTGWVKFEANIYRFQVKRYLSLLKQSATELLGILKREYHLK